MPRKTDLAVPKRQAVTRKPARKRLGSEPMPNFAVAGIGASAGGLEAFVQLLKGLPPETGMAFVLVQHLEFKHDSQLAGLLEKATQVPVCAVLMTVASGRLVLAPRGNSMLPIDCFLARLRRIAVKWRWA